MIIVLDAGHGGNDPGAVGNGMKEADLTLDICKRIQEKLIRKYLTDVRLAPRGELQERAQFANDCNADLFLSIHVNAGGGTGFESYIYPGAKERTRKLRHIIHNAIIALPIRDRGKKEKNLCVLRETSMSAVLLECLFIDNEKQVYNYEYIESFLKKQLCSMTGITVDELFKTPLSKLIEQYEKLIKQNENIKVRNDMIVVVEILWLLDNMDYFKHNPGKIIR